MSETVPPWRRKAKQPNESELYRDRRPYEDDGATAEPERPPAVDPNDVDSGLVRETLLGAIGALQGKVATGRFTALDAQTLDKLLELAKDWPAIAKAVDELKAWGEKKEALAANGGKAGRRKVSTRPVLNKLRALNLAPPPGATPDDADREPQP